MKAPILLVAALLTLNSNLALAGGLDDLMDKFQQAFPNEAKIPPTKEQIEQDATLLNLIGGVPEGMAGGYLVNRQMSSIALLNQVIDAQYEKLARLQLRNEFDRAYQRELTLWKWAEDNFGEPKPEAVVKIDEVLLKSRISRLKSEGGLMDDFLSSKEEMEIAKNIKNYKYIRTNMAMGGILGVAAVLDGGFRIYDALNPQTAYGPIPLLGAGGKVLTDMTSAPVKQAPAASPANEASSEQPASVSGQ